MRAGHASVGEVAAEIIIELLVIHIIIVTSLTFRTDFLYNCELTEKLRTSLN